MKRKLTLRGRAQVGAHVLHWTDEAHEPPEVGFLPGDFYAQVIAALPICCVDTLIVRDGRLLLTRRRQEPLAGQYWIQGGRLHKGEPLDAAALRLAGRECGLALRLIAQLGAFSTSLSTSAHGGLPTHTVNVTFLAEPLDKDQEPRMDDGHDDWTWWDLQAPLQNPYLQHLVELARPLLGLPPT